MFIAHVDLFNNLLFACLLHMWYAFGRMKPSAQKHTLAVLRVLIGKSQKEMAELVKRSARTIQAIELAQLKLSDELGRQIARATGVNLQWLMAGDIGKPIIDSRGKPYTSKAFDQKQAWINRKLGDYPDDLRWTELSITVFLQVYCGVAISALKTGKFTLFNYKMSKVWDTLAEDFGTGAGVGFTFDMPFPSKDVLDLMPLALGMVKEVFKTARKEIKSKKA